MLGVSVFRQVCPLSALLHPRMCGEGGVSYDMVHVVFSDQMLNDS